MKIDSFAYDLNKDLPSIEVLPSGRQNPSAQRNTLGSLVTRYTYLQWALNQSQLTL